MRLKKEQIDTKEKDLLIKENEQLILKKELNKKEEELKFITETQNKKELEEKNTQLQSIANDYYNEYIGFREKILDLYTQDPHKLELLKDSSKSNITTKLFELSNNIKN